MNGNVCILAGPARSGKTAVLLHNYRRLLLEQPIGSGIWLAPTKHAARQIREKLLVGGVNDPSVLGCFSPAVYTFQRFVEAVLALADRPHRYVGALLKRQLIERILDDALAAGRLEHFAPIADRPGLVDLLADLIADLKRQEVSPEQFARCTTAESTEKNRELAAVYSEYQRLLDAHNLYDAEGRFSAARDLLQSLEKANWGPYAALQSVVVDGFSDFTGTQLEILQLLSANVEQLTITLPLEESSDRQDLFNKPRQTKDALQKRFPTLAVQWQKRPAAPCCGSAAMAHLERRLFTNPRELLPLDDAGGIEIVAAAGQRAEIELIARRIKQLLLSGGEPSGVPLPARDIVLAFRSLEEVAPLVEEVFGEYGIPLAIDWAANLNRVPVLHALVGILQLQAADWPFRQLLAVLGNNCFQPDWPEWRGKRAAEGQSNSPEALPHSAINVEWAVRQLQIPQGRKKLLAAMERRSKSIVDEDDEQAEHAEHRRRYRTAAAILNRLDRTLSSLDKTRSIENWIAAVDEVARKTGLVSSLDDDNDDHESNAAWTRLKTALAAGDQLERKWLECEPKSLTLSQFIARVQEILLLERLAIDSDDAGKVRVLAAQSLRGIEVPYLFVAGASEKSFPLPGRDDRIYSAAEYTALNKAGLRFATQHDRACDEMLLFYEVVTRATRRLVISYPALDATAQPLLESQYVVELQRAFAAESLKPTVEISLSPVPQHEHPFSATERRLKAVAELLENKPQRLAKLAQEAESENLIAGLQAVAARARRGEFGALEGMLSGKQAKKLLDERFGLEHCWSVSRLEEYAYCPFRFFAANILGLEPLPELSLEMDYGRRGQLAHEALATLHRRLNDAGSRQSPVQAGTEQCTKLTDDTLALLFESVPKGSPLEQALRTIDFRLIAQWMQQYIVQHEKYDENLAVADEALRPAHFEVSFGLKRRQGEQVDPISTEKAFELCIDGEKIRLSGRIDRIDVGLAGEEVVFNIVDYKTGARKKLKPADFEAGLALQLPLYAMAVQELLMVDKRAVPWRVGYWYLKERGFDSHSLPQFFEPGASRLQESENWRSLKGTLMSRVLSLVRGIRSGDFPVYSQDENCSGRCEYSTVCRIGQIRSMEKSWPLPIQANQ